MTKPQALDLLMLLSALESWGMSNNQRLPDYMLERLDNSLEVLRAEILGAQGMTARNNPCTSCGTDTGLDYQGLMSRARQRAKKEAEVLYPEGDARKEEKERELASEYYRQYTTPNPEAKP